MDRVYQPKNKPRLTKCFFLILFLCLSYASVMAQDSAGKLKSTADLYFENGKYTKALPYYTAYLKQKQGNIEVLIRTGICQYYSNDLTGAKNTLSGVIQSNKKPPAISFLFLGKAYHNNLEFSDAVANYKRYLANTKISSPDRKTVRDDIRRCAIGMKIIVKDDKEAIVENLGDDINSVSDDFAPVLSPNYNDKIYFSSTRKGNIGGLRDPKGFKDNKFGEHSSDMYSTSNNNGQWMQPKPMSSLLNTPRHDVVLDFSADGKVMYFYKGFNLYSGEIYTDTFSTNTEKSLFPDLLQSPMIASEGDGTPLFYRDSILIFSSRREGGFGGSDLYYSTNTYKGWSTPINMGPTINSGYDETTPFLTNDGLTLYFSSNNSRTSMGGLDIFRSKYDPRERTWSSPENIGLPINSPMDDAYFKLSNDGMSAFFSSDRKESIGYRDLFTAYYRNAIPEQLVTASNNPSFIELEQSRSIAQSDHLDDIYADKNSQLSEEYYPEYKISPLYYQEDDDITNTINTEHLGVVASVLSDYPQLKVLLTCHSDEENPVAFNLYFTIKRAEQAAEYLIQSGVPANNIFLKGVGSVYPVAQNTINGRDNKMGRQLNKRIDMEIIEDNNLPIKIDYIEPEVSKFIKDAKGVYYKDAISSLSYKVQVAATKQLYNGEIINNYPDAMVEKKPSSPFYKYTVGLYRTFFSANQLKNDLINQGFSDVFVVPYIKGQRISLTEAAAWSIKYPDLKIYLERSK